MTERRRPLAIPPSEFRRIGHALVDAIAEHLESLPTRPVTRGDLPDRVRDLLDGDAPLPAEGRDPAMLVQSAARLLFEHSLFNGHPRFFGYITAPPAHIGILGDFLAAAVNPNVGGYTLAPVATEIEAQTIRWIAELIGYPRDCGGILVSGGNMANFIGFFAARAAKAGEEVRSRGVGRDGRTPRVYCSAETHTWIQKAADLSGLGTDAIRWVDVDREQRMDAAALQRTLDADAARGDRPFMVVGTAGSVSTGAVDPLRAIARVCRERGLWFHVDGAYGGFAAAVPGAAPEIEAALPLADSVAVDPHKWLYSPLEAGCALVRHPEHLRAAFAYHPPYYHFGIEATNYVDFGPQNSRGFRALKVWLALAHAGRAGYTQSIGDDIRLAARLHERVSRHPQLEPCTCALSITTFRFIPSDLRKAAGGAATESYLNELNQAILDRLQRDGDAFVSNAVVGGRYVLRACIVNFNTQAADIDALPDIVVRLGETLDAQLRARPAGA
ncbi:MAG TPA: aminotransferase class V-fold PLP-dependent enzyme [Vicinamibacterales bacterium]|nr:aminotransferase class V-fold PLP-dependent enzyme [Vicinamibacterales bacterium]